MAVENNSEHQIVRLGDVCETTSGGTPLKSKSEYYEGGTIPWLKSGEVAQGRVYHTEEKITALGLKESSAKLFPVDTVLVAMYGATAGEVGLLKIAATTNQAVCGILPNERFVPEFLFYALRSLKEDMKLLAGGGAQPNISQQIVRDLEIPLPPLEEQRRIVAEIEGYQQVIDGARQILAAYKTRVGVDPEWDLVPLGSICTVISGQHIDTEDYNTTGQGIGYLTGPSDFGVISPLITKWTEKPKVTAVPGDVLVTVKGSGVGSVNLLNETEIAISRQLMAVRAKGLEPKFLHAFLVGQQDYFQSQASGAAIPGITREHVLSLKIPLPPLPEQRRIVAELDAEAAEVAAVRALIPRYEAKIQRVLARVWGTAS